MKQLTSQMAMLGMVIDQDANNATFNLLLRSGEAIKTIVESLTWVETLLNLDPYNRDRVSTPPGYDTGDPRDLVRKYIRLGRMIQVEGLYQEYDGNARFLARRITLLNDTDGTEFYERKHWWLTQLREIGDVWLSYLCMREGEYDFSKYRTNIDISGLPEGSDVQESATLSRLIYGLSSAYMLTGCKRFLEAARAGIAYLRENFISPTDDGKGVIWAFGLSKNKQIITSQNTDDFDTIALYEQIYVLSGMTQYYRITLDPNVLYDIKRTIYTFNRFFHDPRADADGILPDDKNGEGRNRNGYFSHLDFEDMTPDADILGDNQGRKNWNSIGDHIPAYLINLVLALDPLPTGLNDPETKKFLETLHRMLDETANLILEKMPDPDDRSYFVRERFFADWLPDYGWRWQKNRAIVGHNFKIAWNLTRVAIAYRNRGNNLRKDHEEAKKLFTFSAHLCHRMAALGVDPVRGGIYDVIEREPPGERNSPVPRFGWWSTKDFWQQEQGILAALIIYGYAKLLQTKDPEDWQSIGLTDEPEFFRQLASETMAFWNLYFLDRDSGGVFFRTTEDGLPYLLDSYRNKGGHAISGYHAFELNYLAHIYLSTFVRAPNAGFSLRFKPDPKANQRSINVLPDFLPKEIVFIKNVRVNGRIKNPNDYDSNNCHINFSDSELGKEFLVEFGVKRDW